MFENSLKAKIKKIFPLSKVTFEEPATEAKEQDVIFITVQDAMTKVTDKKARAKVTGFLSIFASSEKLPFGFFNKQIALMDIEDTKDLFFYNIDQNAKYYGSLVERRCGFIYFFETQYDPNKGTITSLEF